MKKYALMCAIIGCVLVAGIASAQVFSSSLGGGVGYTGRTTRTVNGRTVEVPAQKRIVRQHKTVLRYAPTQTQLNEEQRERLMKVVDRIRTNKVHDIELVGISRDSTLNYHRLTALGKFFQGYTPNISPQHRYIDGASVLDSNNNTVEIWEYR